MKKLIDYKEEIHKCSKCGLCQSVCPVYKITGNDCSVSRGKFIMLNGIIKGDLKLNKNVNKYLDMCLKCNACKDFCPSGIDARKIFLAAKSQYFDNSPSSMFIKVFQSKAPFNLFLNIAKMASSVYRFLKFDKIMKNFYTILLKNSLGKKIILANEFLHMPNCHPELVSGSFQLALADKMLKLTRSCGATPTGSLASPQLCGSLCQDQHDGNIKVVYFKGCVNEFINPRTKIATENVLSKMGVKILPTNFQCCGVPFLSSGNAEQFKKQAIFNLSQIPDDFDYFLTDCASCQNAFKEYEKYIDGVELLKKLEKINQKSINVIDFIVKNTKSIEFSQKTSFTFHKPCHLDNMDFLKEFLAKSKNLEYVEMVDFDKCCGFSGEFAIKNPALSAKISAKKAQNAIDTNADYILTSCPACVLGLTQGMIENKKIIPTLNLIEFLSLAKFVK